MSCSSNLRLRYGCFGLDAVICKVLVSICCAEIVLKKSEISWLLVFRKNSELEKSRVGLRSTGHERHIQRRIDDLADPLTEIS
jgi:hypothetical protein